ncbi:hypothetical protein ES702_01576 [subsurface metagenome]
MVEVIRLTTITNMDHLPKSSVRVQETEFLHPNRDNSPLPSFEIEKGTWKLCVVGLSITILLSIGCIGFATNTFIHEKCFCQDEEPRFYSSTIKEIASLIFNICVTVCTETLGFIHATSLRWALYHEGRLQFNSNLRLFTNAKKCAANSWYINYIWAFLITVSYSSASQVLLPMGGSHLGYRGNYPGAYALSAQALAILGIALLLQSMLALWCMTPVKSRQILSWNSSPLNTTLALLHEGQIQRTPRAPLIPQERQSPASKATKIVKIITLFLWALLPVLLAWGLAMWFVELRMNHGESNDSFDPQNTSGGVSPGQFGYKGGDWGPKTIMPLMIVTLIQLVYTLALHMAEQIVNLTRDEAMWRRAGNISQGARGAQISPTSVRAVLMSWQSLALLALKPLSHWFFGLSAVGFSFGYIAFNPVPIFCLAGLSLILAVMVTFLAFRKPEGPQPAAWGNVQKLADYIDDWGDGAGGRLYWGDKGQANDTTHRLAGTSPLRCNIGEIEMNGVLYEDQGGNVSSE